LIDTKAPTRTLIGGMGLGYTLKAVLAKAGPKAVVEVGELMPEVIEWNRTFMAELNGKLLADPRVQVRLGDVVVTIQKARPNSYDAILLDVDNGPIPMVHAVSRVQKVAYGEIVATVASKSVGPGTRRNIDEFTRTTAGAVERVGGAAEGKAIIVINPAEPPLIMRNTIHCLTEEEPDQAAITRSVHEMVAEVQKYVPGYTLKNGPVFDGKRITVWMEVAGLGDFLPRYAGNLDIMTAAALRTAEMFAEEMDAGRLVL
jgi:hypothetical protein